MKTIKHVDLRGTLLRCETCNERKILAEFRLIGTRRLGICRDCTRTQRREEKRALQFGIMAARALR